MKKFYAVILMIALPLMVKSQSFTISNVNITGDPASFLEGHAKITNVSGSDKYLLVTRTQNILAQGHQSYFCLVNCYNNTTDTATDTLLLPSNYATGDVIPGNPPTLLPNFYADLETYGNSGFSFVNYCFYDAYNHADSACVEYIFDATTGLTDISNKNYVSKAFPNPATDFTKIYYNLANGAAAAKLTLINMLGAEVRTYNLHESKGTLNISVNDLKPGIYFYSLKVAGKNTASGKFMVTKN